MQSKRNEAKPLAITRDQMEALFDMFDQLAERQFALKDTERSDMQRSAVRLSVEKRCVLSRQSML